MLSHAKEAIPTTSDLFLELIIKVALKLCRSLDLTFHVFLNKMKIK